MTKEYVLKDERATLQAVAQMLRGGVIHIDGPGQENVIALRFNMARTCVEYQCGTVACIGGYAWLHENPGDFKGADRYVDQYGDECVPVGGIDDLYYPWRVARDWSKITPAQAAEAIENYLETGEPYWTDVLCPNGSAHSHDAEER